MGLCVRGWGKVFTRIHPRDLSTSPLRHAAALLVAGIFVPVLLVPRSGDPDVGVMAHHFISWSRSHCVWNMLMQTAMRTVTLLTLFVVPLTLVLAEEVDNREEQRTKAPALSLEGFLDEKLPTAPTKKTVMKVDNGPCYVCHANYKNEGLVIEHGRAEVGCVDCHGESLAHRNDENNTTPPDRMFAADEIDGFCGKCHTEHDVLAKEVLLRWQERCPNKTDCQAIVCTDCHFQHRLDLRTIRWNKNNGELLLGKGTQERGGPRDE